MRETESWDVSLYIIITTHIIIHHPDSPFAHLCDVLFLVCHSPNFVHPSIQSNPSRDVFYTRFFITFWLFYSSSHQEEGEDNTKISSSFTPAAEYVRTLHAHPSIPWIHISTDGDDTTILINRSSSLWLKLGGTNRSRYCVFSVITKCLQLLCSFVFVVVAVVFTIWYNNNKNNDSYVPTSRTDC